MLIYRAAAFLIRTTAPELSMGLPTEEEQRDIFELPADNVREVREVREGGLPALQRVRDILADEGRFDPDTGEILAPVHTDPSSSREASDSTPSAATGAPGATPPPVAPPPVKRGPGRPPKAAPAPAPVPPPPPVFDAGAYRARVAGCSDRQTLQAMSEELDLLPDTDERAGLYQVVQDRWDELDERAQALEDFSLRNEP
jgi:hypothetical protein